MQKNRNQRDNSHLGDNPAIVIKKMENWTRVLNGTETPRSSSQTLFIIQILFYAAIIFVGTLGNIIIFCSIMNKKRRKISDHFIINLTITDLLCCIVSIPFDIMERILGYWPLGLFMCKVVYPLQTILMAVAVCSLMIMAFERYRAIMHPLKPKISGKYILLIIILLWITAIVLVSPYIIVLEMDRSGLRCTENWPAPVFVKAFTASVFVLLYLVPLSIITAAYIRVGARLRRESILFRTNFAASAENHRVVLAHARRNIHVVKIFVGAVMAFAFCLLPFHIMWLWYDFGEASHYQHYYDLLNFANILVYSNSAINPFIFGSLSKRFQNCSFSGRRRSTKNGQTLGDSKIISKCRSTNRNYILRVKTGDFSDKDRLNSSARPTCDRKKDVHGRKGCDRQTDFNESSCPLIMISSV